MTKKWLRQLLTRFLQITSRHQLDLKLKPTKENKKVVTQILCEGKLATFTATIDDLLFCASTAEKTLNTISKMK